MKIFLLVLALATLTACGNDNPAPDILGKDVLMTSDIDSLPGWLPDPNALKPGPAHSGKYALRVDADHEFTPNYKAFLGQLSPTRLRGVKLEAWAYATDSNSFGKLEFVLRAADGQELFREQTPLEEMKPYGTWVPISKEIIFPPIINSTTQLVIYVSRAGSHTPAYVDDLKLTALR
jgi:hypothetical protein